MIKHKTKQFIYFFRLPELTGLSIFSRFHWASNIIGAKNWSMDWEAHIPIGVDLFFGIELENSWKLIGGMRFWSSGNSFSIRQINIFI